MEKKCQPDIKKTKEEVLNQLYVSAYDLQVIFPTMGYESALDYIKQIRKKMENKNLFVPQGKTKLALLSIIKKDCGF